jgi:esterase/lipase superfamily enzyme
MSFPSRLWVLFLVCALSVPGLAIAKPRSEDTANAQSKSISEELRSVLAERLGVPREKLGKDVDLVEDLGLDRGTVSAVVEEVLDTNGVASPNKELTRVGDIIEAVQARSEGGKKKRKSMGRSLNTGGSYVQSVFYVTDRKQTGREETDDMFGGARSQSGILSYGLAEVNIPRSHKTGQIETPWLKVLQDPNKHIFVLRLNAMPEAAFFSDVARPKGSDDVLVYVHGFNVSFDDALKRAAQISVDLAFKGAPIVFSWPSDASLSAYNSDWEDVNWSTKHIEAFLDALTTKVRGKKIHLIAHSMGSKGLLNALRLLSYRGKAALFGTVILCAPDFDAGLFQDQIANEIRSLASQWVVYASKRDVALSASSGINTPRLGTPFTLAKGYEIIDASEIEVTPWNVPENHSYYATKKVVLDDMVGALSGKPAGRRALTGRLIGADTIWAFSSR